MKQKSTKKLIAVLSLTLFLLGLIAQPALALDFGVYTASTTTSYVNPETGTLEDGGTQNVELGEGMCRSAVGETALIEVDAKGNTYITVRMQLYSNLSKIKFYTQSQKGGSYNAVSASITAENAGNDSADYRIKVPSAGCNLKTTMYVSAMGREVTFFWKVNSGSAKSGNGDFVVNINLNEKPKAESETQVTENNTAKNNSTETTQQTAQNTVSAAPSSDNNNKNENTAAKAETVNQTDEQKTAAENSDAAVNAVDEVQIEDNTEFVQSTEEEINVEDTTAEDAAEDDVVLADEETTNSSGTTSIILMIGIICAALIAVWHFVLKK